jgi:hypothetical protein
MTETKSQKDYDVRVRERNLKRGVVKPDEVKRYLDSLPDLTNLAQQVEVTQPGRGGAEQPVHSPALPETSR